LEKLKISFVKKYRKIKNMSSNTAGYDVFLSYQWDVKESVLRLYNQLTKTHGLSCWMDVFEMGNGDLNESKF